MLQLWAGGSGWVNENMEPRHLLGLREDAWDRLVNAAASDWLDEQQQHDDLCAALTALVSSPAVFHSCVAAMADSALRRRVAIAPSYLLHKELAAPPKVTLHDFDADVGALQTRLGLAEVFIQQHLRRGEASALDVSRLGPGPLPTLSDVAWACNVDEDLRADILQLIADAASADQGDAHGSGIAPRLREIMLRRDRRAMQQHMRAEELVAGAAALLETSAAAAAAVDTFACVAVARRDHPLGDGDLDVGVLKAARDATGIEVDRDVAAYLSANSNLVKPAAAALARQRAVEKLIPSWMAQGALDAVAMPCSDDREGNAGENANAAAELTCGVGRTGSVTSPGDDYVYVRLQLDLRSGGGVDGASPMLFGGVTLAPATVPPQPATRASAAGVADISAASALQLPPQRCQPRERIESTTVDELSDFNSTADCNFPVPSAAREIAILSATHSGHQYVHTRRRPGDVMLVPDSVDDELPFGMSITDVLEPPFRTAVEAIAASAGSTSLSAAPDSIGDREPAVASIVAGLRTDDHDGGLLGMPSQTRGTEHGSGSLSHAQDRHPSSSVGVLKAEHRSVVESAEAKACDESDAVMEVAAAALKPSALNGRLRGLRITGIHRPTSSIAGDSLRDMVRVNDVIIGVDVTCVDGDEAAATATAQQASVAGSLLASHSGDNDKDVAAKRPHTFTIWRPGCFDASSTASLRRDWSVDAFATTVSTCVAGCCPSGHRPARLSLVVARPRLLLLLECALRGLHSAVDAVAIPWRVAPAPPCGKTYASGTTAQPGDGVTHAAATMAQPGDGVAESLLQHDGAAAARVEPKEEGAGLGEQLADVDVCHDFTNLVIGANVAHAGAGMPNAARTEGYFTMGGEQGSLDLRAVSDARSGAYVGYVPTGVAAADARLGTAWMRGAAASDCGHGHTSDAATAVWQPHKQDARRLLDTSQTTANVKPVVQRRRQRPQAKPPVGGMLSASAKPPQLPSGKAHGMAASAAGDGPIDSINAQPEGIAGTADAAVASAHKLTASDPSGSTSTATGTGSSKHRRPLVSAKDGSPRVSLQHALAPANAIALPLVGGIASFSPAVAALSRVLETVTDPADVVAAVAAARLTRGDILLACLRAEHRFARVASSITAGTTTGMASIAAAVRRIAATTAAESRASKLSSASTLTKLSLRALPVAALRRVCSSVGLTDAGDKLTLAWRVRAMLASEWATHPPHEAPPPAVAATASAATSDASGSTAAGTAAVDATATAHTSLGESSFAQPPAPPFVVTEGVGQSFEVELRLPPRHPQATSGSDLPQAAASTGDELLTAGVATDAAVPAPPPPRSGIRVTVKPLPVSALPPPPLNRGILGTLNSSSSSIWALYVPVATSTEEAIAATWYFSPQELLAATLQSISGSTGNDDDSSLAAAAAAMATATGTSDSPHASPGGSADGGTSTTGKRQRRPSSKAITAAADGDDGVTSSPVHRAASVPGPRQPMRQLYVPSTPGVGAVLPLHPAVGMSALNGTGATMDSGSLGQDSTKRPRVQPAVDFNGRYGDGFEGTSGLTSVVVAPPAAGQTATIESALAPAAAASPATGSTRPQRNCSVAAAAAVAAVAANDELNDDDEDYVDEGDGGGGRHGHDHAPSRRRKSGGGSRHHAQSHQNAPAPGAGSSPNSHVTSAGASTGAQSRPPVHLSMRRDSGDESGSAALPMSAAKRRSPPPVSVDSAAAPSLGSQLPSPQKGARMAGAHGADQGLGFPLTAPPPGYNFPVARSASWVSPHEFQAGALHGAQGNFNPNSGASPDRKVCVRAHTVHAVRHATLRLKRPRAHAAPYISRLGHQTPGGPGAVGMPPLVYPAVPSATWASQPSPTASSHGGVNVPYKFGAVALPPPPWFQPPYGSSAGSAMPPAAGGGVLAAPAAPHLASTVAPMPFPTRLEPPHAAGSGSAAWQPRGTPPPTFIAPNAPPLIPLPLAFRAGDDGAGATAAVTAQAIAPGGGIFSAVHPTVPAASTGANPAMPGLVFTRPATPIAVPTPQAEASSVMQHSQQLPPVATVSAAQAVSDLRPVVERSASSTAPTSQVAVEHPTSSTAVTANADVVEQPASAVATQTTVDSLVRVQPAVHDADAVMGAQVGDDAACPPQPSQEVPASRLSTAVTSKDDISSKKPAALRPPTSTGHGQRLPAYQKGNQNDNAQLGADDGGNVGVPGAAKPSVMRIRKLKPGALQRRAQQQQQRLARNATDGDGHDTDVLMSVQNDNSAPQAAPSDLERISGGGAIAGAPRRRTKPEGGLKSHRARGEVTSGTTSHATTSSTAEDAVLLAYNVCAYSAAFAADAADKQDTVPRSSAAALQSTAFSTVPAVAPAQIAHGQFRQHRPPTPDAMIDHDVTAAAAEGPVVEGRENVQTDVHLAVLPPATQPSRALDFLCALSSAIVAVAVAPETSTARPPVVLLASARTPDPRTGVTRAVADAILSFSAPGSTWTINDLAALVFDPQRRGSASVVLRIPALEPVDPVAVMRLIAAALSPTLLCRLPRRAPDAAHALVLQALASRTCILAALPRQGGSAVPVCLMLLRDGLDRQLQLADAAAADVAWGVASPLIAPRMELLLAHRSRRTDGSGAMLSTGVAAPVADSSAASVQARILSRSRPPPVSVVVPAARAAPQAAVPLVGLRDADVTWARVDRELLQQVKPDAVVRSLAQRVSELDLGAAASASRDVSRYLRSTRPFFVEIARVALLPIRVSTADAGASDATTGGSPVVRLRLRLVGAIAVLERGMCAATATPQESLLSSTSVGVGIAAAGDALLPHRDRDAMADDAAVSFRVLAKRLRSMCDHRSKATRDDASAEAALEIIQRAVAAEAARRRLAALVVELTSRGLHALALLVAGWLPPSVPAYDGAAVEILPKAARRAGVVADVAAHLLSRRRTGGPPVTSGVASAAVGAGGRVGGGHVVLLPPVQTATPVVVSSHLDSTKTLPVPHAVINSSTALPRDQLALPTVVPLDQWAFSLPVKRVAGNDRYNGSTADDGDHYVVEFASSCLSSSVALAAALQTYIVNGRLVTPFGQTLRHPAAIVTYVVAAAAASLPQALVA